MTPDADGYVARRRAEPGRRPRRLPAVPSDQLPHHITWRQLGAGHLRGRDGAEHEPRRGPLRRAASAASSVHLRAGRAAPLRPGDRRAGPARSAVRRPSRSRPRAGEAGGVTVDRAAQRRRRDPDRRPDSGSAPSSTLLTGRAHFAHVDVMDGIFCPQLTVGPAFIAAVASTGVPVDAHLWSTSRCAFLPEVVAAGAGHRDCACRGEQASAPRAAGANRSCPPSSPSGDPRLRHQPGHPGPGHRAGAGPDRPRAGARGQPRLAGPGARREHRSPDRRRPRVTAAGRPSDPGRRRRRPYPGATPPRSRAGAPTSSSAAARSSTAATRPATSPPCSPH